MGFLGGNRWLWKDKAMVRGHPLVVGHPLNMAAFSGIATSFGNTRICRAGYHSVFVDLADGSCFASRKTGQ